MMYIYIHNILGYLVEYSVNMYSQAQLVMSWGQTAQKKDNNVITRNNPAS